MILVTVGTQDVPFDRLIKGVEKQIEKGNIKEEVIVQSGCSKYTSNKMKMIPFMDSEDFNECLEQATLIITHGGVGTITSAINAKKTIIVCPRLAKYREANNDHQLQIIKEFSKRGYIIPLDDPKKLDIALKEAKNFKPQKYKSNTKNMLKIIEDFIDAN